jgi:DNA-binding CsgD family transcriptional regulator
VSLAERRDELEFLKQLFAEQRESRSCYRKGKVSAVSIIGPVGSGKTEFLHTFAVHAVQSGAAWLYASGSRAERNVPLGILAELFRTAPLRPDRRARAQQLLGDCARMATGDGALFRDIKQTRIMYELWAYLVDLADARQVLLSVDDIQYADDQSLGYLLSFIRRLTTAGILLIFTRRECPGQPHQQFDIELLRQPRSYRIRLAPLTQRGVSSLLAERMQPSAAARLAAACHQISGGSPLLVRALANDQQAPANHWLSEQPLSPAVGKAFSEAVLTCLHRCEPDVIQVARAMAVLDSQASPSLIGQLTGAGMESVNVATGVLYAIGLCDSNLFRHPAARDAVLSDMAPSERMELHRNAASTLHAAGSPASAIARHLISASAYPAFSRPDEPWAPAVLRSSAEQALSNEDITFAIECLKLAARACSDDQQRILITAMLAQAEWRISPSNAAPYLSSLNAALHNEKLGIPESYQLIQALLWHGRFDQAVNAVKRLGTFTPEPNSNQLVELSFYRQALACSYPSLLGRIGPGPGGHKWSKLPASAAEAQMTQLLNAVLTEGPDNELARKSERILEGARLDDSTFGLIVNGLFTLVYAADIQKAALWGDLLLKEAAARFAPTWHAVLAGIRAEIAIRQGDLSAARDYSDTALELLPREGWGIFIGIPLAGAIRAATEMGDYGAAVELMGRPVPEAMFGTRFGLHYLHARGRLHRALDHPDDALSDFLTCGKLMTDWKIDVPTLAPWRTEAAEVALRMGSRTSARRFAEDQLKRPGANTPRIRGISLRALAATSDSESRPRLLRESVVLLHTSGDRLELAHSLAQLCSAFEEIGDSSRTRLMKKAASDVAASCAAGHRGWALIDPGDASTADDEGRDIKFADGLSKLTDAERRVAALAAWGYTNVEIARKLYVTVSTVEQHLTRTYRKLNVKNRANLAARLPDEVLSQA